MDSNEYETVDEAPDYDAMLEEIEFVATYDDKLHEQRIRKFYFKET